MVKMERYQADDDDVIGKDVPDVGAEEEFDTDRDQQHPKRDLENQPRQVLGLLTNHAHTTSNRYVRAGLTG